MGQTKEVDCQHWTLSKIAYISWAHVVVCKIFDAPPVTGRKLHDFPFQPPLSSIPGHGLAPRRRRRLVVCADPGREALVRHLARYIAVDGCDELVVEVFSGTIGGGEDGPDALAKLGLIKAP